MKSGETAADEDEDAQAQQQETLYKLKAYRLCNYTELNVAVSCSTKGYTAQSSSELECRSNAPDSSRNTINTKQVAKLRELECNIHIPKTLLDMPQTPNMSQSSRSLNVKSMPQQDSCRNAPKTQQE